MKTCCWWWLLFIHLPVLAATVIPETKTAEVSAEASLSAMQAYPDQSLIYTLKVVSHRALQTISPQIPNITGIRFTHLQKTPLHYSGTISGQHYNIYEFHYAITASHAGTFSILGFPIQVAYVPTQDWQQNFQSTQNWQANKNKVETLNIHVAETLLKILPIQPKMYSPTGQWLPAYNLTMKTQIMPEQGVRLGESLRLIVTIDAIGIEAMRLPDLSLQLKQQLDFKVYAEKPTYKNKVDTNSNVAYLHANKTQVFTLVPQQEGLIIVPELKVYWWNNWKKRINTSEVVEKTFVILDTEGNLPTPKTTVIDKKHNILYLLSDAQLLFVALLCVVIGWWLGRRQVLWLTLIIQIKTQLQKGLYFVIFQSRQGRQRLHQRLSQYTLYQYYQQRLTQKFNRHYLLKFEPRWLTARRFQIQMEKASNPQQLLQTLQHFAHHQLNLPLYSHLIAIQSGFQQRYPQLDNDKIAILFQQLSQFLYAQTNPSEDQLKAWLRQFKQHYQYLPFYLPQTITHQPYAGLLPLNPNNA